jgi:hypothetical protein
MSYGGKTPEQEARDSMAMLSLVVIVLSAVLLIAAAVIVGAVV